MLILILIRTNVEKVDLCVDHARQILSYCVCKILTHHHQGCISCSTCSYPELTEDHVLKSAYVKILRTVTRNAVNKSV